jgi:DNA ligase (NAD+)
MNKNSNMNMNMNTQFANLMNQLSNIMTKQGEPFRARAYQKAHDSIIAYPNIITNVNQLKGVSGIGNTIFEKLKEYTETGTLQILEREKTNPINILGEIYGIGPKKAQELVATGITNIEELRKRQNELLNDIQKVGLYYHEQIQKRIPRAEIDDYKIILEKYCNGAFEIVGSYRRGATDSGDIDIIITGQTNDNYKKLIYMLVKSKIIVEILSQGESKTLVIARLSSSHNARRLDFLYCPPNEYAFALLYFTGSKTFNTLMRQYALNKGYTFNEHGIYMLVDKVKGTKVTKEFPNEKAIFDFLGLEYKAPHERIDGRSIQKSLALEDYISDFQNQGIQLLEQLDEDKLTNIIKYANDAYYNNNSPIMTDNEYDIIKEYMKQNYPQNEVIMEIGAKTKVKVKLPYEMASMDKIKPDSNALSNWVNKYKGSSYVLSCKLDGVSGLYSTEGKMPKLYTRGDGKYGQDISHLIPYLRLPKVKNIVIRGEFIISKKVFEEKYKSTFANPRNMVAGLINQKTVNNAINDVCFVAYEVIVPELTPYQQMEYLGNLDVECVLYNNVNNLSNTLLSNLLVEWRENHIYEIDGVIVTHNKIYQRTSGNPEHAFAFKMVLMEQMAEALVVDVLWTPSKDGYLKPRVQIEPIQLGGVCIEYATGFNGAYILKNKIGVGATIKLIRSGDVIPHIIDVIVPAQKAKMPEVPYKWNDTQVDIMLVDIMTDPTVRLKNITGFFKGIEVDGLSSGNILRIMNAGYDSVSKIIHMSVNDLLEIDGFKEKMANKIYNGIHQKLNEATIIQLMTASNIFGRGFSEKKIESIMTELPYILVSVETQQQKINAISGVKMMSLKSAELFVSNIEEFKTFMIDCGLENKLYVTNTNNHKTNHNTNHILYNKKIVLTGTRDKNIIQLLQNIGAIQGQSVSKNTFLVIAKDKTDETGKVLEAKKLNIPIVSVEEFMNQWLQK